MNPKQKFGCSVRRRRLEISITQKRLAELSDLHRTYIADVERGERNVSLENIVIIVRALGLTLDQFFRDYYSNETDIVEMAGKWKKPRMRKSYRE